MMKEIRWFIAIILVIIVALVSVVVLDAAGYTTAEIERYSIGMEITHAEKTAYYIRNHGEFVTLTFYLRGDDRTIAIDVDPETYARFKQGDWVEVEIQVTEHTIFHDTTETARIIGAMEKN